MIGSSFKTKFNNIEDILNKKGEIEGRLAFNVAPADARVADYDLGAVDLLMRQRGRGLPALAGVDDPSAALERAACERFPDTAILLTLGREGLRFRGWGEVIDLDAFSVEAVDETAAGDAFIGYLMAALLEARPVREALITASAAGALAVTRAGAATSVPARDEVGAFVAERVG